MILSYDQEGNDVPKGTLESIKRQSGLPKKLFRNLLIARTRRPHIERGLFYVRDYKGQLSQ